MSDCIVVYSVWKALSGGKYRDVEIVGFLRDVFLLVNELEKVQ